MESPLLEVTKVRVDEAGVPAIDGLSLTTTATRVAVLGAARALFEAASGMRSVAHGEVRVNGIAAPIAVAESRVAGAALDAPMPAEWTPRAYVTWSARLAGHRDPDAKARADEAIARMKMGPLADTKLGKAPLPVRRGTAIAAAIATGAPAVFLEDPLATLSDDLARSIGEVIVAALADRSWIVFASRLPIASPIALHAAEAIVVAGADVTAQGTPAELAARARSYALDVRGPQGAESAFRARLEAAGARVEGSRGTRLVVDLPDPWSTRDLLAQAEAAGAVILELRPLARALS